MKRIIEKAFLDIIVTLVILLSIVVATDLIRWFLFLYTPVILAARIIALYNKKVKSSRGVSDWVFHTLYAINVIVLLYHHWWILATLWLAIWILAIIFVRRRRTVTPKKPTKRRR